MTRTLSKALRLFEFIDFCLLGMLANIHEYFNCCHLFYFLLIPGRIAQSITCLATDACLTADPGSRVRSRAGPILSWRLIMKSFLQSFSSLPLNESFKKGCCQLRAKVYAQSTG